MTDSMNPLIVATALESKSLTKAFPVELTYLVRYLTSETLIVVPYQGLELNLQFSMKIKR
jgi:hypothetical protein